MFRIDGDNSPPSSDYPFSYVQIISFHFLSFLSTDQRCFSIIHLESIIYTIDKDLVKIFYYNELILLIEGYKIKNLITSFYQLSQHHMTEKKKKYKIDLTKKL